MKVSVLQWNIWTDEDPRNILSQLRSLHPDIICLQEVTKNAQKTGRMDAPQFLMSELQFYGFYVTAQERLKQGKTRSQGNMILSRYPIVAQNHVFVQPANDDIASSDYSKEGRVLLLADIQVEDTLLKIGTTHLSYTDRFVETLSKKVEANALLEATEGFENNFILTGDFNVTESSPLITTLSEKYQHCGPDFSEKSWTTKPFSYGGFTATERDWRLDYVFASKDLRVEKSEVVQTEYSDHLPVLVDFSL